MADCLLAIRICVKLWPVTGFSVTGFIKFITGILNEARSNNFIKEDYSIRFGPMSGNVHELIFEYFLDKKELDIAFPEEPLYELVNQQNARIYIGIIKSLQSQNIDLG